MIISIILLNLILFSTVCIIRIVYGAPVTRENGKEMNKKKRKYKVIWTRKIQKFLNIIEELNETTFDKLRVQKQL